MFSAEGKYDELGTHYYKNSLFGTPFESGKQISIINYDPYMNGRWKETRQTIKGPGVNYDKMAAASKKIPMDLQNKILLKHKERLQNVSYNLEELRNRALNFQIETSDNGLKKSQSESHGTGIRTFRATKPTFQKYQYSGNILDLQYSKTKQPPEVQQMYQPYQHSSQLRESRDEIDSRQEANEVLFEKLEPKEYAQFQQATKSERFPFYRSVSERDMNRQKYQLEKFDGENLSNVPSNIKHKFGSRLTDELLSEQVKVNQSLASINKQNKVSVWLPLEKPTKDEVTVDEFVKKDEEKNKEPLEDISNYLRSAICHGLPMKKNMTSKQLIHSAFVNKQHLSDPNNYNSPNRRKKDWLGDWISASQSHLVGSSKLVVDTKKKNANKLVGLKQLEQQQQQQLTTESNVETMPLIVNLGKLQEETKKYDHNVFKNTTAKKSNRPKNKQPHVRYATSSPINRGKLKAREFDIRFENALSGF